MEVNLEDAKRMLKYFRCKELKDVLGKLNESKMGKKEVLVERIINVLNSNSLNHSSFSGSPPFTSRRPHRSDIGLKYILDAFRELEHIHISSGEYLSLRQKYVKSSSGKRSESSNKSLNVRCVCGYREQKNSMVQCHEESCSVFEHISCAIIEEVESENEKEKDKGINFPKLTREQMIESFVCECCRIKKADPFCVVGENIIFPAKFRLTHVSHPESGNPLQIIEKTFSISKLQKITLLNPSHDVQVWSILLNDRVKFRIHWPSYCELKINGKLLRVCNRPGQQLLGINGRDDFVSLSSHVKEGQNTISISAYDSRPFCIGVQMIRRRSVEDMLKLIPPVEAGEKFSDALSRLNKCFGKNTSEKNEKCDTKKKLKRDSFDVNVDDDGDDDDYNDGDDDGSDDDLQVLTITQNLVFNLRCPMSGSRIQTPGRFKSCQHLGCFDLYTFLQLNKKTRKWLCPICMKNNFFEDLIIDPLFNRITSKIRHCAEDVVDIEVREDLKWRPKPENPSQGQDWSEDWYSLTEDSISPICSGTVQQQQHQASDASLKVGIKRGRDGQWKVSSQNSLPSSPPFERKYRSNIKRSLSEDDWGSSDRASGQERDCSQKSNRTPQSVEGDWGEVDEAQVDAPMQEDVTSFDLPKTPNQKSKNVNSSRFDPLKIMSDEEAGEFVVPFGNYTNNFNTTNVAGTAMQNPIELSDSEEGDEEVDVGYHDHPSGNTDSRREVVGGKEMDDDIIVEEIEERSEEQDELNVRDQDRVVRSNGDVDHDGNLLPSSLPYGLSPASYDRRDANLHSLNVLAHSSASTSSLSPSLSSAIPFDSISLTHLPASYNISYSSQSSPTLPTSHSPNASNSCAPVSNSSSSYPNSGFSLFNSTSNSNFDSNTNSNEYPDAHLFSHSSIPTLPLFRSFPPFPSKTPLHFASSNFCNPTFPNPESLPSVTQSSMPSFPSPFGSPKDNNAISSEMFYSENQMHPSPNDPNFRTDNSMAASKNYHLSSQFPSVSQLMNPSLSSPSSAFASTHVLNSSVSKYSNHFSDNAQDTQSRESFPPMLMVHGNEREKNMDATNGQSNLDPSNEKELRRFGPRGIQEGAEGYTHHFDTYQSSTLSILAQEKGVEDLLNENGYGEYNSTDSFQTNRTPNSKDFYSNAYGF